VWIVAGAVFWFLILAFSLDWVPWFRGYQPWPPEWRWRHETGLAPLGAAVLVLLALAGAWIIGADALKTVRAPRRSAFVGLILGLYLILVVFQFTAACTRTPRVTFLFAQRTYVGWLNSFYLASLSSDSLGAVWREYDRLFKEDRYPRVVTHPPGFITYYAAVRKVAEALRVPSVGTDGVAFWRRTVEPLDAARVLSPASLVALVIAAFLQPLLANLAVIPLFDLVRRQWSTRTSLRVGFLYVLVPAVVLFVPSPDEFFLPLAAVALWGFCLGCDARIAPRRAGETADMLPSENETETTRAGEKANAEIRIEEPRTVRSRPGFLLAAGMAVAIHSLFGYHFTVLVALFGVWRVILSWRDSALGFPARQVFGFLARDLALFLAPMALLWLGLWIVLDFNMVEHWFAGVGIHRRGITQNRSYWAWLAWNLWDLVFFLGLPALAAVGWSLWKRRLWASPYVVALAVTVLAVDLSGAVRGETARILLFLYPLMIPLAAPFLADPNAGPRRFRLLALHQVVQLACMALYLNLF